MPVTKKRNESTETRLLLEDEGPVELPPAEVEAEKVIVQFDSFKPFIPELLEALRAGTVAEPVPVMLDGSTFVIHGATRSFWVKLWHSSPERTRVERVQVISCMPSTRGLQVFIAGEDDDDEYLADEDYTEDDEDDDEASFDEADDDEDEESAGEDEADDEVDEASAEDDALPRS